MVQFCTLPGASIQYSLYVDGANKLPSPNTGVPCSNAVKTRNLLKFAGVPQTGKPISAAIRPKFTILSEHVEEVLLFNKFFSDLSIHASIAKL